ncbi:hypothetical protein Trydic_g13202 [Trypoxylus dichotomus]
MKDIEYVENFQQVFDKCHVVYGHEQQRKRLKPRKGFLQCTILEPPDKYPINESPCTGSNLVSKTLRILNRLRTSAAPIKIKKLKWKIEED